MPDVPEQLLEDVSGPEEKPGSSPDAPSSPDLPLGRRPSYFDEDPPRRSRWPALLLLLLLAAAAVAVYWWMRNRPSPRPAPAPAVPTAPAIATEDAEPAPVSIPPLPASDAWVRDQLASLSGDPTLEAAVQGEGLAQRLVAAVLQIAEGATPRRLFPGLRPAAAFAPEMDGERATLGSTSYRRYDGLVQALGNIDAAEAAAVYRRLLPLLEAAYQEIGPPDASFADAVEQALVKIQAAPDPGASLALRSTVQGWAFADPSVEALSPLQKQLLRMGPDNAARVRAQAAAFHAALATNR